MNRFFPWTMEPFWNCSSFCWSDRMIFESSIYVCHCGRQNQKDGSENYSRCNYRKLSPSETDCKDVSLADTLISLLGNVADLETPENSASCLPDVDNYAKRLIYKPNSQTLFAPSWDLVADECRWELVTSEKKNEEMLISIIELCMEITAFIHVN